MTLLGLVRDLLKTLAIYAGVCALQTEILISIAAAAENTADRHSSAAAIKE